MVTLGDKKFLLVMTRRGNYALLWVGTTRSQVMRYLGIILGMLTVSACQTSLPQGEQAPAYRAVMAGA
ncbi:MAG: hypothetical protein R6X06_11190, partial [Gammaproteobacteria bacterium]